MPRFRHWSALPDGLRTGPRNLITDVPGLTVGHHTLVEDAPRILRTGVTVLRIPDALAQPVAAASHVFNGYGKTMGLVQIDELGTLESPIWFTNTLSIGAVQQGAVQVALREKPGLRSFNAVVTECNDSHLSDIATLAVTPAMAVLAHDDARADFPLGSVGAGAGMVCFGFKGGIGSASRVIELEGRLYTVGALVLANFGRREDLRLPGVALPPGAGPTNGSGSLIMVVGTDLPLLPHQLRRVTRHMSLAIGLLGGPGGHGSGDIAIAFSTGCRLGTGAVFQERTLLANEGSAMDQVFRAATWACAESILDAMVTSPTTRGLRGTVDGLGDLLGAP